MSRPEGTLRIRGAREHNLAGIVLDVPLGKWIAVIGPSGSGKTSLVFDTIVREGERRFLGSMSTRARQFFGKLGRSATDEIRGLPATIAVGEKATTPSSRSTVGTLTGTLDLLRLVFARAAEDPGGEALTRSHFSFNHPTGQCSKCKGIGLVDRVDPDKIVADPKKSIRDGALVPTLKNGYTVYSQVTLEVMNQICRAHGFDVETPWQDLTDEQRDVIFHGTQALKVPFGKHSIESRMKWEGITARPREEGYYQGLVPVIAETLKRNRNENILRFVSSAPCEECGGSRLARAGREARFGAFTLPDLLALSAEELVAQLDRLPDHEVWRSVRPGLEQRVVRLVRLGLGHLSLSRTSTSLSGGEAQRVRLAAQLGAGLSGVLFALDEPTLGLHPESQTGMRAVLDELIENGNSLLVVEHDPDMVRHADHVVSLGPGAGVEGGRVVHVDWPGHAASGARQADPLGTNPTPKLERRSGNGQLRLTGATLHNLQSADLELRLAAFNVVCGPSGAGKSSLLFGTLLPALTGERGGPFKSLEWIGNSQGDTHAVDARPIGKTPRSTPATWCGLFDIVRKRFGATPEAKAAGFTASHFSFNNKRGRCETCEGLGVTRIGLHLFEDIELDCEACEGRRYDEEILQVGLRGKNIAEVLSMSFREAVAYFAEDEEPRRLCEAMVQLGLGYLTLGQSSGTLSRGEAQRIKLGTLLGSKRKQASLILLDEPDRGLAPTDVAALLEALDALVEVGHTVVAISHHRHVWAAADHIVEVRDGETNDAPALQWEALSVRREERDGSANRKEAIRFSKLATHNLRDLDVSLPRDRITAICGVSGSGKSSLAFDSIAAEAQHRFAESLPFQVRRFLRRLPKPSFETAEGLSPTLDLRQRTSHQSGNDRSTVATQSECGPLLRLLYSRAGLRNGVPCALSASHFSRERAVGACSECSGAGTSVRCDPERLVTAPGAPLIAASPKAETALAGSRPGRFFTEFDGQHIATLRTALRAASLDESTLETLAWRELDDRVRDIALHGTGPAEYRVTWQMRSKVEGDGTHEFEGPWLGLCALVEQEARNRARSKRADEWSAPLGDSPCPACDGSGLAEAALQTTLFGLTLPDLEELLLSQVADALRTGALRAEEQQRSVLASLLPELEERLNELVQLGLGHLTLQRKASSLSRGELQRVRLASTLRAGLTSLTLVLDEPTTGLHERDVAGLLERLREFRDEGNTIVLVSHRPTVLAAADHVVQLGPGAGSEGGTIVSEGPPGALEVANHLESSPGQLGDERIRVRGARANNLDALDCELPARGFVCVTGVSGSGKTSLTFDVIGASLARGTAWQCAELSCPTEFAAIHDTRRDGKGRSALHALELEKEFAALFAHSELPIRAFQPGHAQGRCATCKGTGRENVSMDILADLQLACPACEGSGFRPEVLQVSWHGKNVAEWLSAEVRDLRKTLAAVPEDARSKEHSKLVKALETLEELALGHIALGTPRRELSGGESARIDLTASLLHAASPAVYLFDEPSTGLHEADLAKLVNAFRRLASRGDLVLATEHRLSAIRASDWVLDLGPEGGAKGGRLVASGAPETLTNGWTADALRSADSTSA